MSSTYAYADGSTTQDDSCTRTVETRDCGCQVLIRRYWGREERSMHGWCGPHFERARQEAELRRLAPR